MTHSSATARVPLEEPLRSAHFNSAREYESSDVERDSPPDAPLRTRAIHADIVCRRHKCVLTFLEEAQTVKITRTTESGKQKTLLYVPVYVVLNAETAAEREARQRMRVETDDSSKDVFVIRDSDALQVACLSNTSAPAADASSREAAAYTHLRGDTAASMATTASPTSFQSPSGGHQEVYFLHYVSLTGRKKKSIHTVSFTPTPASGQETALLTKRIVQAVYKGGIRHLIFFISRKSGAGRGEKIFEKEVRPLLHFTRHQVTARVTQRAHDCEDFCADVNNELSAQHVVVGVGGDGMANEIINGLHRRKLAILSRLRRMGTNTSSSPASFAGLGSGAYPTEDGPNTSSHTAPGAHKGLLTTTHAPPHLNVSSLLADGWCGVLPLVATLATGSACGLAKSLGVLTPAEGGLALVHLNTVDMDLMRMSFTNNDDLVRHHEERLSARKRERVLRKFRTFQESHSAQDETPSGPSTSRRTSNADTEAADAGAEPRSRSPHGSSQSTDTGTDDEASAALAASPFRRDGSGRYSTAVAHHLGAPDMHERVAFMSLSFGMANDIDRGSEHLRWMGNTRFAVYGGYCLLFGVRKYRTTLRYLPWKSASTGKGLEKLHSSDVMPSTDELPICTMRGDCPHCLANQPAWVAAQQAKLRALLDRTVSKSPAPGQDIVDVLKESDEDETLTEISQTLRSMPVSALLNEDTVDFSGTEEDGWVTISGAFYNVLLCNLRDVAQDMNMAPRCHMSDGAIDVVFSRIMPGVTKGGGRKEFVQMMGALETGEHVKYGFVNYIKARAVEIKVDDGISMSDGEMMPLSSVCLTKMRNGVRFVRSD